MHYLHYSWKEYRLLTLKELTAEIEEITNILSAQRGDNCGAEF